ncbi:hypothetical protein HNQ71_004661 [Mesorhizobium sangaii]|uniref:ParB/Sulfiredoxin domain-containing protein n=1 Tax=Mesorhizobium sangaii TaxID=505389 RepID=A0A841PEG8_9HYPH|nr:hypothetical protein [Mesorhizobium sangaii]
MIPCFTTDDHARQEQVWEALENSWSKEPQQIRRLLTETTVRASDRRALFVGVEAYVAAGGVVLRDLFESDNGGWLQDPALLDRLVGHKLKSAADQITEEGWKWIVVDVDLPYGHNHGLRSLAGTPVDLTDAERAEREALRAEYERLEAEYGESDELPDELDQRLQIETALGAFESRPMNYDRAEIARAGVFISIDRDGDLVVDRGHVRPEDEAMQAVEGDYAEPGGVTGSEDGSDDPSVRRATITIGAQASEPEEDDGDAIKPLPERLVIELTAHRTLALRNAVAENQHVAITALLHRLVLDTFGHRSATGCVEAFVRHVHLPSQDVGLKDSPAAKAVDERHGRASFHWVTTRPYGLGSTCSMKPAGRRCWRIASAMGSTPCSNDPIPTAAAFPSMGSISACVKPIGCPVPPGLTWWMRAGARRSKIISAGSPSPASSKPCAKVPASRRPSSSTISRRAIWPRRPNAPCR